MRCSSRRNSSPSFPTRGSATASKRGQRLTRPIPTSSALSCKPAPAQGKTAEMAICAWHFLLCQGEKDGHPNAYAISVTGDNLKDNFWKEMAVWRGRSSVLQCAFEWTAEKIYARDHLATWWLKARSWPKTANSEEQGRTGSTSRKRLKSRSNTHTTRDPADRPAFSETPTVTFQGSHPSTNAGDRPPRQRHPDSYFRR